MKYCYLFFLSVLSSSLCFSQILDFENLEDVEPGDKVSTFHVGENCQLEFFTSYNLKVKESFYLQRVGVRSTAAFQGPKSTKDCNNNTIPSNRFNNMNNNPYQKNKDYSNRERVGCQFISATLRGTDMPSVFIKFANGTKGCSGDILDVDGANNAIEAYEIYYYKTELDYPNNPINKTSIPIRTSGSSLGTGEIGDDGGIEHFEINSEITFTLVEIRPNQKPSPKNKLRTVFGFALDNFSPCSLEKKPFTPPYLIEQEIETEQEPLEKITIEEPVNEPHIEDVYFDFDKSNVKSSESKKLDELFEIWEKNQNQTITLTAYTDPKGSNEYNIKLSQRRVNEVKSYLIDKGIPENLINTDYKGEIYNGDLNDPDWKKRKVHIELK